MRVPPGVSPADFAATIKQFETVVGKEWVFTSDEDVVWCARIPSTFRI
ncbi:MAG: hypothetical protein WB949_14910 [Candidatus Acidiferrales bacterium]